MASGPALIPAALVALIQSHGESVECMTPHGPHALSVAHAYLNSCTALSAAT